MDWQDKLITSYLFICNEYKKRLWAYCERMTNHADMSFTDEEVITIFINGVIGRRFRAKAANEIATSNGYCATKKMYYYGVKLHIVGAYKKGSIPVPMYIGLTNAGVADRKAYEQILPNLSDDVFADKAYQKENKPILRDDNALLHTPVKKQKGQTILDSADKLLSSAISSIRQPIESLFNWLEEKTKIQVACKVRSYNGLMVHVFGRIAAAFFMLMDKFCS